MFETAEVGHEVGKKEFDAGALKLRTELLKAQQALREAKFPVIVIVPSAAWADEAAATVDQVGRDERPEEQAVGAQEGPHCDFAMVEPRAGLVLRVLHLRAVRRRDRVLHESLLTPLPG